MYARAAILLTVLALLGFGQPPDRPPLEKEEPKQKTPPSAQVAQNTQQSADEALLKNAGIKTDSTDLLDFFRKRTLAQSERPKYQKVIRELGSQWFRHRDQAMNELVQRGPAVSELLREALKDSDLEIATRAEKCLARIQEKDVAAEVPTAAVRLLGARKPAEAVATLFDYLPFADNDGILDQLREVLSRLATDSGKANPILVKGLEDPSNLRRAVAAEALAKANLAELKTPIRKLLQDRDPVVRLRVAIALAYAKDAGAVPVLIDVLPQLPMNQAWVAEDVLYRLGEGKNPPAVAMGQDEATRKKCRDAWHAWWEKEGKTIDLARLSETPPLLGYTLVILLDEGRVMELNAENKMRWQVNGLVFPLDAQVLPGGERVLVAEYHAQRVTERDMRGEVVWQHRIEGPLVAQRLASGNTFIATDSTLLEVSREGKEVVSLTMPNSERIMKALKLPNGEIAVLTSEARIVRLDAQGKELSSFTIEMGTRLFGGRIHMLPNGRVLVPHNAEGKVVEYDARGKVIWEVAVDQPIAATRLPNGNTLVTSMLPNRGAVEFDRAGNEVWTFRATTRVTRAIRR